MDRSADDNLTIRCRALISEAMADAKELGCIFPGNVKLEAIQSFTSEILQICRTEILEAQQLTFAFAASSIDAKEIKKNRAVWEAGLLHVFELAFAKLVTQLKNRSCQIRRGLAPHFQRIYAPKARAILIEFFDYEADRAMRTSSAPTSKSSIAEVSGG